MAMTKRELNNLLRRKLRGAPEDVPFAMELRRGYARGAEQTGRLGDIESHLREQWDALWWIHFDADVQARAARIDAMLYLDAETEDGIL